MIGYLNVSICICIWRNIHTNVGKNKRLKLPYFSTKDTFKKRFIIMKLLLIIYKDIHNCLRHLNCYKVDVNSKVLNLTNNALWSNIAYTMYNICCFNEAHSKAVSTRLCKIEKKSKRIHA